MHYCSNYKCFSQCKKSSAAFYYHRHREFIYSYVKQSTAISGEIEIDESHVGGKCKGQKGRGRAEKVPVFGILKIGKKVYTQIIPIAKSTTLLPIIQDKVKPDSIVYTDNFLSYDVLDVSGFKHFRITTVPALPIRRIISMVLRTSGIKQSVI